MSQRSAFSWRGLTFAFDRGLAQNPRFLQNVIAEEHARITNRTAVSDDQFADILVRLVTKGAA